MLEVAASLNVVLTIFDPERSPALNRVTWVLPSGPIRTALRLARFGSVRLSVTLLMVPTVEAPWPVIVSGELRLEEAGIVLGWDTEDVTVGLIMSDQLLSVAVLPVAALVIRSFQVPLM